MEQQYLGSTGTPAKPVTESERLLGVLSHVLTFVVWIFAPLVIYFLKKDESEFVRIHAKESINFQLTLMLYYLIAFITLILLVGIFLFIVIGIFHVVLIIVATIRAADEKLYRYPYTIRFIQ
ncbi:MAG: DUF4870 domain-containing protein [Chitinophagaceae bacterium]|jgi:uncharacterized Tic20 family protein